MKIAVQGCTHGELECIYDAIEHIQVEKSIKIDMLICCGDFESIRDEFDMDSVAVPDKYRALKTFHKFYTGERKAPCLTIFIGGNHEASNYLAELPFGGWVAPNIYYLGYAGCIRIGNQKTGIRVGGISGIWKAHDYRKGHFEMPPFDPDTLRSIYHQRCLEVFRLKQMSNEINKKNNRFDIFLSHDWPKGVHAFGDEQALVNRKKHFKGEIDTGTLGSPACSEILYSAFRNR